MMYTFVLALIAGGAAENLPAPADTLSPDVRGIHCYSDHSCPWYCIGCGCCGNTCWFGAGLVHCHNEECELCKATAQSVIGLGSEAACDATADSVCMAAGGAFVDPVADVICTAMVVPLCSEIFSSASQPSADAACKAIGMCSSGMELAAEALSNQVVDSTGRINGFAYEVCARQDFDYIWGEDEEDVDPNCGTYTPDTHGCDTEWMKKNCAGTCKRCPGATTRCIGSKDQ